MPNLFQVKSCDCGTFHCPVDVDPMYHESPFPLVHLVLAHRLEAETAGKTNLAPPNPHAVEEQLAVKISVPSLSV